MKSFNAVARKEFLHILRDPRSLTVVFVMPVLMILIYGYSISFDLNRIDAALVNMSGGEPARQLAAAFAQNHYFVLRPLGRNLAASPLAEAERLLRAGQIKEYILIPADFSRSIQNRRQTQVGFVIDGSDANSGSLVYQYSEQVVMRFLERWAKVRPPIRVQIKIFFNPEIRSYFFFIPGISAVLMLMISALLTSISVSREKETGSIELLFISPLPSRDIILGKTLPYFFVALLSGAAILLFAHFWFAIPFRGNVLLLLFFSVLYIFTGLSFGILISTAAPSQRVAMIATLLATLMPSILLSGFIFPLDSLPAPIRAVSYAVPATYFLRIIRGLMLKGAALRDFLLEGGVMILFSVVMMVLATVRFARLRRLRP